MLTLGEKKANVKEVLVLLVLLVLLAPLLSPERVARNPWALLGGRKSRSQR